MGYERDMNGIPSGNLLQKEFANCLFTRGYRTLDDKDLTSSVDRKIGDVHRGFNLIMEYHGNTSTRASRGKFQN